MASKYQSSVVATSRSPSQKRWVGSCFATLIHSVRGRGATVEAATLLEAIQAGAEDVNGFDASNLLPALGVAAVGVTVVGVGAVLGHQYLNRKA